MLIKYILIFYLITQDCNDSLSIREDIVFAKKYLEYHGISDKNICLEDSVNELCYNEQKEICSARLFEKKMEFKQFENPCYMELNNLCESQDNIWAIKNSGPCVMNAELRRFAQTIEKMAGNKTESIDDEKTTDGADEDTTYETTTDETATESVNDEPITESTNDENESVTDSDETESNNDTSTGESGGTETTTDVNKGITELVTGAELRAGGDQIGKIIYDDGSEKLALREASSTRFPPTRAEKAWDKKTLCVKRIKPCPAIYYPVCLYFMKERPNNVTYYYFINSCEAQQWTCYHPEHTIDGTSSIRAGYCAHIQYINYARFFHTMSAWGHYGWLHGPWRFNHILKPHERAFK